MLCARCGLVLLDGFKFCHHCGAPVNITTAAPELTIAVPDQTEGAALPEPVVPALAIDETEAPTAGQDPDLADPGISVGRMFLLDLLCYIPLVNLILLAVLAASGRRTSMREVARGKLLALMTVTLVALSAALVIVLLLYLGVIEPIYLGWWKT